MTDAHTSPPENALAYAKRRSAMLRELGDDAVLILTAAPELRAGRDGELRYRIDPDLFYLTGYPEPEAVAVLDGGTSRFTLFVRERDAERERWNGPRGGLEAARERYGAQDAFAITELEERLPKIMASARLVYARPGASPQLDAVLRAAMQHALARKARTGRGPLSLSDPALLLDEMRLRKDPLELALMREAARISTLAFRHAAGAVRHGGGEWEVEAALDFAMRREGADGPAFPTIVASGANATVLHYTSNDRRMLDGQLVLVDGGARHRMYCADISRTFPVSGSFTAAQRDLYDIVLAARDAAIACARPGVTIDDVHRAALHALLAGLSGHGLLQGSVEDLLANEEDYKVFLPHRTSHWLGLDVHDAGDYVVNGTARALEAGMVLTIEPGLYVSPESEAPADWRGAGVRIEDDVLITLEGCEVLTRALPADAESIEAMVGERA
jgi:Xaa-Pro aminopeptidase